MIYDSDSDASDLTFVLVAGGWHGSWCWERVIPHLEAHGAKILAPDLVGVGEDADVHPGADLHDWADQLTEIIQAQPTPVILVGHSRAGIILSTVAERIPERIRALVYVAAFMLPSGTNILAMASTAADYQLPRLVAHEPDGTSTLRPELVEDVLYNRTEPFWVARALSKIGREPMLAAHVSIATTAQRYGSVSRTYIECLDDRTIPLRLQRDMQALSPCDRVFTIDADHSPFYSAPEELARCLLTLTM